MPQSLKIWLANGLLLVGSLFITLLVVERCSLSSYPILPRFQPKMARLAEF